MASASSSAVIIRLIFVFDLEVCCHFLIAETNAAIPVFISDAPRPYSVPSLISASKGGNFQSVTLPIGTTSTCPANAK